MIDTSVAYILFKERVSQLAQVDWYVKADLKNGYRQFPVHPSDWHTQIYSLGPKEFYIDITMPFGKANSSRVFCTWSSTWCKSLKFHFQKCFGVRISLSSYGDDFFRGPICTGSMLRDKRNAKLLFKNLIRIGKATNTLMNIKKCLAPARRMDILGISFNSVEKSCFLTAGKAEKYHSRLVTLRKNGCSTSKNLEKIVGNLGYAAWVIPYGRPFISHISKFINPKDMKAVVKLDNPGLAACDIWLLLLKKKRWFTLQIHSR